MREEYERLQRCEVNHVSLSPLSLFTRTAEVYPDATAIIYGERQVSWAQMHLRCRRLASALARAGVSEGDTVAILAANTPEMLEAHFGVPMCGGVLNALNVRLDPSSIAFMLRHAEAKVLIADLEYSATVKKALAEVPVPPLVIDIRDPAVSCGSSIGTIDYEEFLETGDPAFEWRLPDDEWQAITLNYTSGTTGNPKGVVYHHRGAYLAALSNLLDWQMPRHSVFLWTLPLFHCNGWCFPWALAASASTSVCMRGVDPIKILQTIAQHRVTHYCGAPIVHAMLADAPNEFKRPIRHKVHALIGGAPPPVPVLESLQRIGFEITQIYGLTEVFGPAAVCAPQQGWTSLEVGELARRKSRQGVRYLAQERMQVLDPRTLRPVPADGCSIGEVAFRGNLTMKGYLKNAAATAEAFRAGWFWSGDLAVVHADGYIQIRDRAKDIIISGGENINSLEIEEVLYRHPAVKVAAVVGAPDPRWGETPVAFVETDASYPVGAEELISHCRAHLAGFKVPRRVVMASLPKTATGKIQKFELRAQARALDQLGGPAS